MGGCDEEGAALASVEALSAGRWEALPSMRRERCNFAAAVVAGRILVAGGYDARGLCLSKGWCNRWPGAYKGRGHGGAV